MCIRNLDLHQNLHTRGRWCFIVIMTFIIISVDNFLFFTQHDVSIQVGNRRRYGFVNKHLWMTYYWWFSQTKWNPWGMEIEHRFFNVR